MSGSSVAIAGISAVNVPTIVKTESMKLSRGTKI